MIKFTVIMPVYNVEKYLKRSVENIINQKYSNWELYLVNDGSTDSSGEICDFYAGKYNNIKVIHQHNSGSGIARQNALDVASGDYICFVDPDDFLETDALLENSKILEIDRVDILVNGFYEIKSNWLGKIHKIKKEPIVIGTMNRQDFISNFEAYNEVRPRVLWNKLYKRSFITKNNIKFTNQRVGQDALFNYEAYKYIQSMLINGKAYYNYDTTREGSAVKKYRKERFNYEINLSYAFDEMLDSFNKDNVFHQEKLLGLWSAIIIELKNINFKNNNMTLTEKIQRINMLREHIVFENMFIELDDTKIKSPVSKLCFNLLKKKKIKLTQWIIQQYVRILNY